MTFLDIDDIELSHLACCYQSFSFKIYQINVGQMTNILA